LAPRHEKVPTNVTVNGRKGKRSPSKVQGWAFKMKVTLVVSSYVGV